MARLLLFAAAREAAGCSRETIPGETVADVLAAARRRFGPTFESVLGSCTVWVNGEQCEPATRVDERDEVAVIPPVSGGSDLAGMTLEQVRERRAELQAEEDAVSFVRRIAQGRLDIAREEARRRASGEPREDDVTGGITRVFSAERGTGSNRPPRDTTVAADHRLLGDLERLCESVGFGGLGELDDAELATCTGRLAEFEAAVSARRRDLFAEIDALSQELVRRYRSSTSSVDALLDESR